MDYVEAIILGVVQGIAEFLPISSSGHLVIVNSLTQSLFGGGIPQSESELIVALHVGTLLSILVVYRRDLATILTRRRLCGAIVLSTAPLVLIALLPSLRDWIEAVFKSALIAGCGLLVTSLLLAVGGRMERDSQSLNEMTAVSALAIGLFQALALLPGISRSGSTIAGGMLTGLRREAATTFSFFIAIPAIAGAAGIEALNVWSKGRWGTAPDVLLLGAAVAFVVGVVALRWLIRLVSAGRLHWFSWYCAAAGLATIVWQLSGTAS